MAMILQSILLQHFRNYTQQKFDFADLTIVIGPNTAGKTNLAEAIHLLLTGKSFRTSTDIDMITFGQDVARVQGLIISNDKAKIEVVIASPIVTGSRFSKKFLLNGVAKAKIAIVGLLPIVLFRPEELEIIVDGPSLRREFLDNALESADREYLRGKTSYERALRQRNALLRIAKEARSTGSGHAGRLKEQFAYWDSLLIENGQILTKKRAEFLDFINESKQTLFPVTVFYDKSTISPERLEQYKEAEVGTGVTLVGPHRDDFVVQIDVSQPHPNPLLRGEGNPKGEVLKDIRHFGSRGQERLAVLQLKLLQIEFLKEKTGQVPLLVLDDIFSELDSDHIKLVLGKIKGSQIILTTTHKEFIPKTLFEKASIIELSV